MDHSIEFEPAVRLDHDKEVSPRDWGRAMLEELLLKAAKQISADPAAGRSVSVQVSFDITADEHAGALVIAVPGEIERALVTRLPMRPAQA